jgi:hypothetical protein
MNRGLLLTMTEPPQAMEEEFNAWYDDEHMAERLAIPGFRSARRWVADLPPGEGKYLATYELDSPEILPAHRTSPASRIRRPGASAVSASAWCFAAGPVSRGALRILIPRPRTSSASSRNRQLHSPWPAHCKFGSSSLDRRTSRWPSFRMRPFHR